MADKKDSVVNNLQRRCDKYFKEMILAKARVYDLEHRPDDIPSFSDLKSRVISLENDVKQLVKQRDELKRKVETLKGGTPNESKI